MTDISVVIPVGPDPIYLDYLPECLDSIYAQTYLPLDIVLVDDGANLDEADQEGIPHYVRLFSGRFVWDRYVNYSGVVRYHSGKHYDKSFPDVTYLKNLWNVGVADSFNFGVALAQANLVFMLGSDDKMMPTCLEEVVKAYDTHQVEGWYNVTHITEGGAVGAVPNNTAAVTKELWNWLGGFPPSAGVAACDALLLSILMVHAPEKIIQVKEGTPLCWLREGAYQDTRKNMAYFAQSRAVEIIRDLEAKRWTPKN